MEQVREVDVEVDSIPPKQRDRKLSWNFHYEKLSVSVRDYGLLFKNWLREILLLFIKINMLMSGWNKLFF